MYKLNYVFANGYRTAEFSDGKKVDEHLRETCYDCEVKRVASEVYCIIDEDKLEQYFIVIGDKIEA